MTSVTRRKLTIRTICGAAIGAAIAALAIPAAAQTQTPSPARPAPAAAARPKPAVPPSAMQAATTPPAVPAASAPVRPAVASAKGAGDVVARVGTTDVTSEELRAFVATLGPREQAALAKNPALLSQAVRSLLANRLVLQEVLAKKWDQQPNVAAQLERLRENALVELYLQTVSVPPANFPGEDDLQKVYEANRAAFLMPRQFQLSQIFVAAPKEGDKAVEDQARKNLDDVQRKLKAPGADFAAIAAASDGKDNSEIGWVPENQVRPEIRAQVTGLAKGAVSEPIRLDDGWHIIKLVDTKMAYTRTLPEVRDQLVEQMRAERAAAMRRAYQAELLKQNPPIVNEFALSNLLDQPQK